MSNEEKENATREPAVGDELDVPRVRVTQTEEGVRLYVYLNPDAGEAGSVKTGVLREGKEEGVRYWDKIDATDVPLFTWSWIWACLAQFEMQYGETTPLPREDVTA